MSHGGPSPSPLAKWQYNPVAHRLDTVIDYDRLIVMDAGRVVEFDTPSNLLQKEDGVFRSMCMKSANFAELEEIARAKAMS